MSLERIKAMPVQDLAEENSHLYLWIPNALLQEGLDVIKAWGFTYRSPIYWIKPRLLLGNYYRNASETCLFATRGKAPVKFLGVCHTDLILNSLLATGSRGGIYGGMKHQEGQTL